MTCIMRLDGRLEFTYFFFIEFFFHKFHYFNIELVGNLAFQFFFQDYPYKFHMLTQINLGRSKIFLS